MISYDIVLASYNGENFITEQIESIFASIKACSIAKLNKFIISDDNSTDSTCSIVEDFIKYNPDLLLIRNKYSSGVKNNFQNGLDVSNGQYVFLSDQDDVWYNEKIEKSIQRIIELESVNCDIPIVVFTDVDLVDENLKLITSGLNFDKERYFFPEITCFRSFGQGCTMLLNRNLISISLPIPQDCVMHDWWFLLVASNFGKVSFIDEKLIAYRQHNNNVCGGYKNSSVKRFFDFYKQKKYMLNVSKQSKCFLVLYVNRFNSSFDSFKFHSFVSNLSNHNLFYRVFFIFSNKFFIRGFKNNLKLFIQIILA